VFYRTSRGEEYNRLDDLSATPWFYQFHLDEKLEGRSQLGWGEGGSFENIF